MPTCKRIAVDLSDVVVGLAKGKVEVIVGVSGADVLHRKDAVIDYARSSIFLSY